MLESRLFLLGQHRNEINDVITPGFLLGQHRNEINNIITPHFLLGQHGNEINDIIRPDLFMLETRLFFTRSTQKRD